jgi:hypothetical protein
MHYANGREAKAGDVAMVVADGYNRGTTGVIYEPLSGSDTCNARMAARGQNDPTVTVKECLHIDDVNAATKKIVDKHKEKEFSSKT